MSLPTATLPKLTDEGVAASVDDVAVAFIPTTTLVSVALLAIAKLAVSVPAATGLYVTVKFAVCPAASVAGAVIPETLTPVPEIVSLEIVAVSLPVFST